MVNKLMKIVMFISCIGWVLGAIYFSGHGSNATSRSDQMDYLALSFLSIANANICGLFVWLFYKDCK